ncbi:hypothetical protein NQ318_001887 [Aromia moschata]|uniref:C2H2-type domain-containing protein n=1 Tax=Aromia moschata TaxID=1265417 RepID=A0AAV8Z176_9CUCU|nr:hypothetical protein NQ318_001887 [Aromia moschata]
MAPNEERLCRLCLKETKSDFLAIEGITREMLEAVLQNIDLSLKERVTASTNGLDSTKVDVVEVAYLSNNQNEQAVSDSDHSICRLCMKRVYCIALDLLDEDFIMKMVPKCIPQINLRITARPMFCEVCVESLNDYFHFMSSCYDTEEKISEHLKFQGAERGQVDLRSIHRIPVKNDANYNIKCQNDTAKSEFKDVHSCGYPVKLEDELIIKNEDEVVEFKEEGNRLIEEWLEETGFEVIRNPFDKKHYKCKRCPYKTKYRHILKRHSSNHAHPSQLPKLKCLLCSYEARREHSLKRHMKEHNSSATIYKCVLCTFSTLNKTTFNSHQLA